MTKEKAKDLLPIIQAFAEGKTIQYFVKDNNQWFDVVATNFTSDVKDYRIKPEVDYVPFDTVEELKYKLKCRDDELAELKAENEALQVDISMAKEERDFVKSKWKSCFLSCSSPYCAEYFRDVKCEGTLGSMSKSEGEK